MVYLYTFHFSLESQEVAVAAVPSALHVLLWARECACGRTDRDPGQSCGSEFITVDI